jgi:hypothetical protein
MGMSRFFRTRGARADDPAREREPRHLLPRHAFAAALARSLRLLRSIHVPITLFAVALPARGAVEADACVTAALLPFGVVGRLPDGRIGLLYLGPHSPGEAGAEALAAQLLAKVVRHLRERGWEALSGGVRLAAARAWTDAIARPAELLQALEDRGPTHKTARARTDAALPPGPEAPVRRDGTPRL